MQRQQNFGAFDTIDIIEYSPATYIACTGSAYTGGNCGGRGRSRTGGGRDGNNRNASPAHRGAREGGAAYARQAGGAAYARQAGGAAYARQAGGRSRQPGCAATARPRQQNRAVARTRRKKRRHGVRLLVFLTACLCLTVFGGAAARLCMETFGGAAAYPTLPIAISSIMYPTDLGGAWDAETETALRALAQRRPEIQPMLDNPAAWPADVAALLARNEEALDFVLAYPSLADTMPPDAVEEAQKGVFPVLLQWDARWGAAPYAGSILALSGCGPTVLSVVACGLTGSDAWTPAAIAEWAQGWGYATASGTSWDLMRTGCEHFGVKAEELSLSETTVFRALEAGSPIICSVRPGDFTTTGHFIVLTGTEDGLVRLVDPNSPARSATLWEWDRLMPQIKNLWAYTAI